MANPIYAGLQATAQRLIAKIWAGRQGERNSRRGRPSLEAGAGSLTAPSATGTAARGVITMLQRSLLAYSG